MLDWKHLLHYFPVKNFSCRHLKAAIRYLSSDLASDQGWSTQRFVPEIHWRRCTNACFI